MTEASNQYDIEVEEQQPFYNPQKYGEPELPTEGSTLAYQNWVSEYGVVIGNVKKQMIIHVMNGSLVINPLEGPYEASNFDAYIKDHLEANVKVLGRLARIATWNPAAQQYDVQRDGRQAGHVERR